MYLSFGLDGEFVAIGAWHMAPETLARYRAALDTGKRGLELKRIIDGLVENGFQIGSMEALKRVPPPYRQDHPCAELLKRKGLAVSAQPSENITATPAFVDWSEAKLREAAPMVHWMEHNLFKG
jgi:uncharacterized protein (DUF2461 family)